MSPDDEPLCSMVRQGALILAERLRAPGGTKATRRQARTLLKEAYRFEEAMATEQGLNSKTAEFGRTLALQLDEIFKTLSYPSEEEFLSRLAQRYAGPSFHIGQRIRAPRVVLAGLDADRMSATFTTWSNWFWERSQRAQSGLTGTKLPLNQEQQNEPTERESFEFIWRKRKK